MYRGVRDLPGGGAREPGDGPVRAVPRGAHGVGRRLQHGQDHDRGQRRHLRHHRGGRAGVRGGVAAARAHRTPPSAARQAAGRLLRRARHAQPRRPALLARHPRRVRQAA